MKRNSLLILLMIFIINSGHANAQNKSHALTNDLCHEVFNSIKATSTYSYHYEMNMEYPNGDKDRLMGDVFCDIQGARLMNKNNFSTTLFTGEWYLSAIHDKKSLVVYNLPRIMAKEKRKPDILQQEFRQAMQQGLPDSQLLSRGVIEKASVQGSVVSLIISFPVDMHIQKLFIAYNRQTRNIESVKITCFYPFNTGFGNAKSFKGKGTLQEVTCSKYSKDVAESVFATNQYFKIESGTKVKPVQFKNYKLTTNLQ